MKLLPLLMTIVLGSLCARSQTPTRYNIRGRILDEASRSPLADATINLLYAKDSTSAHFTSFSINNGSFAIAGIPQGHYIVFITYLGYQPLLKTLPGNFKEESPDLGDIRLIRTGVNLSQVEVIESRSPVSMKVDTMEYNASYYKTKETSTMEVLLKKIPGIEITPDGNIKINGKPVKTIMIDGHPYFGNNTRLAVENLLAGMAEKIQLIDRKPELDGQNTGGNQETEKAINITIKKDHLNSINGFLSAGYGSSDKFTGKTSINYFTKDRQLTFLAGGNNMNGFMDNMASANGNGLTRSLNTGINYNQTLSKKINISGSYYIDNTRTEVLTGSLRQNFLKDSSFYYRQNSDNLDNNTAHSLDLTFNYKIDSLSTLTILNRLNYREKSNDFQNDYSSFVNPDFLINKGTTHNSSKENTRSYVTNWTYNRTFKQPGRRLVAGFNLGHGNNRSDAYNASNTKYQLSDGQQSGDSLKQFNTQKGDNKVFQATLNYTQPIIRDWFIDLSYIYTNVSNYLDKQVYGFNYPKLVYDKFDDSLSGKFTNISRTRFGGLMLRYKGSKLEYAAGINMVNNTLINQNMDHPDNPEISLFKIFPNVFVNYDFDRNNKLNATYNSNVQSPGIEQLRPIPDNSNPLYITIGNPDLKATRTDNYTLGFRSVAPKTSRTLYAFGVLSFEYNKIVSTTNIDSLGRQVSKSVNVNGAYNASLYIMNTFPLKNLRTSINSSTSFNFNKDFASTNGNLGQVNKSSISQSLSFSYTHKELFDLMLSAQAVYNKAHYFLQETANTAYFDYLFSMDGNINLPLGFTIGTNFNYILNTGRAPGYNADQLLLNAMISKSVLPQSRGQLKLQVFDLLDRNISYVRNTTPGYIEDVQANPIKRFVMLGFTYYFKPNVANGSK